MNRLERLQALERGATKGPWETRRWPHRATELIGPADPERPGYRLLVKPHKDLIYAAALRNAAPDLIRVALAAQHVVNDSPGTPSSVKHFLRHALAPLLEGEEE